MKIAPDMLYIIATIVMALGALIGAGKFMERPK
jgi:hypothetical protein